MEIYRLHTTMVVMERDNNGVPVAVIDLPVGASVEVSESLPEKGIITGICGGRQISAFAIDVRERAYLVTRTQPLCGLPPGEDGSPPAR